MKSILIALLAATALASTNVFRFHIQDEEQLLRLEAVGEILQLDFWTDLGMAKHSGYVDVAVPEEVMPLVERLGLEKEVFVANLEDKIAEERERILSNKNADFFEEYQTLDSIHAFYRDLAASYPNICEVFSIGKSYEGRDLLTIRISSDLSRENKPVFYFHGGTHSREWIGQATVAYMANEFVVGYGVNPNVTSIVNQMDIVITSVLNPDGYIYTWSSDRMWRKNREPNSGSACYGVDMNRNWVYRWNNGGSSSQPCSDSYHGPSAGSTPEIKAASSYIDSIADRLAIYIDFHAYSQLVMTPWGWSCTLPADYQFMYNAGVAMADAIRSVYGTRYETGSICQIIYQASGSSADYVYGTHGVALSYGIELRDTGRYGFLLPADQIIPSGIETFEGVLALSEFYLDNQVALDALKH